MALTRNEIRKRLSAFAKEHQGSRNERSQAQTFWLRFYECFGIRAESATIYEQSVKKLSGAQGFIDSFIPGKLIIEHKSEGKDLDAAFDQAAEYFLALKEEERPRYIITSDFARIRLYDLQAGGGYHQCKLAELPKKADWFMFLVEGEITDFTEESEADRSAAYAISKLHEELLRANFKGRKLEVLLTRLLFCLFADDTGIFGENGIFLRLVEGTRPDGKDLGGALAELFQVLNTPEDDRQKNLDEALARFAYINGNLFAENSDIPSFDSILREQLIACAKLDWSGISPAIFGAMFQGVLEEHNPEGPDSSNRKASRRELGAHYTSERNILRVINPLCMNDLRAELAKVKRNKKLLQAFYDKLPTLTFFDPACGCGNFLVIGFRELRQLEMDTIEAMGDIGLTNASRGGLLDVSTLCRVKVNQFYGIEIDESAAHIARVAMWITDHQMNLEAAERFGTTRPTVPLVDSATIACGNSLRLNWHDVLPAEQCSYVLGNPPFVGHQWRSPEQMQDMDGIWGHEGRFGRLDYVTCWHHKAAAYMHANMEVKTALVSTNSICQGEQVGILWSYLLAQGVQIHFAHRAFQWSNEGKGVAAVHCVIVGFALNEPKQRTIFDYGDNIKGEPVAMPAHNINPYLVDAPNVILPSRTDTPPGLPQLIKGSQPTDGGHLILTDDEKAQLLAAEPQAEKWLRPFIGGEELINGGQRWCLWLKGISPTELKAMPHVMSRLENVRKWRLTSATKSVREWAARPSLFTQDRQPKADYLAVPRVSSERRLFIPIAYLSANIIAHEKLLVIEGATLYHFGILNSTMHNAWMRAVAGRLESRYSYAPAVYNNFPWPDTSEKHNASIETAAQAILDARALYPESSLADLYDPISMPPELVKAHAALDKAVDAAYSYKGSKDDAARVAFLFDRYQQLTSLLPAVTTKQTRKRSAL
ncbi:MAG: DNA methyltransferase MmeI [Candidatus Gallionella acididurans]|uniref:site-specific DNA-methyltransferase (adenine-specific) n=1 Tax=Candidatus Gallionella acididurans TaxID=1796491 RepID=A0A139BRS4_9PROT|nr:MAG: DNA methyltransferase MmeI [Candidatus Gallionella acididurans]